MSLLDGEIQFLDGSLINPNEISNNCYWDFGDGSTSIYIHGENPTHIYKDTGDFKVSLFLENKGLCKDSSSTSVCLISENKLLYPDIFTPNGDNCNDEFYLSGLGEFIDFNVKIYNRWGVDMIFESEEIILTDKIDVITAFSMGSALCVLFLIPFDTQHNLFHQHFQDQ